MPVDLNCFNEYLYNLIPEDKYKEMYQGVREYLSRGGKRFRPVLLLLTYASFKEYYHDILFYAAIIELFHNFTLIHDDIEDGSELRRGKPTLHKQYGIPLAINIGDALYTFVLSMVNSIDDKNIRKAYLDTFMQVVEGQALDIYWRENKEFPDEAQYYKMISKKTGVLIGLSMYLGAYLAGYQDKRYYELGTKIGVAFQIQDDLLNLESPPEYGKTWADDITEGKRTIMVVKALSNLEANKAQELKDILNSNTKDSSLKNRAIELIKAGGGIEYAKNKLLDLFKEIDEELLILFNRSNSYNKELLEMIDKMKVRKK